MEYDLINKYQRLGSYRNTYLKLARAIVYAGLLTMFVMGLVITFTNMKTSQLEQYSALKSVIYSNIRHVR